MFRVSQEIRLYQSHAGNGNNATGDDGTNGIFGKYQKTPDADLYDDGQQRVFVAPELTDAGSIQVIHFPSTALAVNSDVNFILKRNGVRGNFEVKLEMPSGEYVEALWRILDPERVEVSFTVDQAGLYKVHIKCNSVPLPKSPFIIVVIGRAADVVPTRVELPVFNSDASKVLLRGPDFNQIRLNANNEFIVDGSEAGNNMLFVGILGPNGQCDEVAIKHLGNDTYRVNYRLQEAGEYILAAKWGDDHIPGSPFHLYTL